MVTSCQNDTDDDIVYGLECYYARVLLVNICCSIMAGSGHALLVGETELDWSGATQPNLEGKKV